jgi:SHS family lactate transporter-like MFS transporter
MVGIAPAILVFLIRMHVEESPAFEQRRHERPANPLRELRKHWKIALYVVVLMTAFNFFSHGTQDMYPTFLKEQHHFDTKTIGLLAMIGNVGAIVGGISFGIWSEHIGRKRAIIIAALLAIPIIPLWAFASTPIMLGLGAFLIQVAVQGAWGIVPVHLNELSPALVRGMFPGFAYQLGNLIASRNGPIQAWIAESHGGNFGLAMAIVAGITVVVLVVWTAIGPERTDVDFLTEKTN